MTDVVFPWLHMALVLVWSNMQNLYFVFQFPLGKLLATAADFTEVGGVDAITDRLNLHLNAGGVQGHDEVTVRFTVAGIIKTWREVADWHGIYLGSEKNRWIIQSRKPNLSGLI